MSLGFIHEFQVRIYQILSSNKELRNNVDLIYLSVVQDARYPFLLINILNVSDISKFGQAIYDIEFEISAFARDKNQGILTTIANQVTQLLHPESCAFQGYIVAGINPINISFNMSNDLVTRKLTIHYKAMLRGNL